jgi:hypothetical protein
MPISSQPTNVNDVNPNTNNNTNMKTNVYANGNMTTNEDEDGVWPAVSLDEDTMERATLCVQMVGQLYPYLGLSPSLSPCRS